MDRFTSSFPSAVLREKVKGAWGRVKKINKVHIAGSSATLLGVAGSVADIFNRKGASERPKLLDGSTKLEDVSSGLETVNEELKQSVKLLEIEVAAVQHRPSQRRP